MGGYTIVQHEIMDSEAARLLSVGGRCVLFDFLRHWNRATENGRRAVAGVLFTWAGSCNWRTSRKAWDGYRAELIEKGFLAPGPLGSGLYGSSDDWRRYQPAQAERAALAAHDARRRTRGEETKIPLALARSSSTALGR